MSHTKRSCVGEYIAPHIPKTRIISIISDRLPEPGTWFDVVMLNDGSILLTPNTNKQHGPEDN